MDSELIIKVWAPQLAPAQIGLERDSFNDVNCFAFYYFNVEPASSIRFYTNYWFKENKIQKVFGDQIQCSLKNSGVFVPPSPK